MTDLSRVSIGLPGATDPEIVRGLAPRIEAAGFRGLWLNDTPQGDSLAGLAEAVGVTQTLQLGTGVIPLDRRSASSIAGALEGLPLDRLTIGVGSGGQRDALRRVAEGVAELKRTTGASIVVGALGPRMRRLGAQSADGVLLSWLTPSLAAAAMDDLRRDAGGREVRGILYARAAVERGALDELAAESARYESYPSYAAHFERVGVRAPETTIDGTDPVALSERIERYTAVVDELVLRAIPTDTTLDGYVRFIDLVALSARP